MSRKRKAAIREAQEVEMNESGQRTLISEVGSPQHQTMTDHHLCTLLEMQHRNLIDVLNAVKSAQSTPAVNNFVVLPKFNPDSTGASAAVWCATMDLILAEILWMVVLCLSL